MVKKMLLAVMVMVGLVAAPRPALAGCTVTLSQCMEAAAKVDSFWYRFASGLDCELDYAECVRTKLLGI
jgi:hypothetical protein